MALNAMLAEAHWAGATEAAGNRQAACRSRPAARASSAPSSTRTRPSTTRPPGSSAEHAPPQAAGASAGGPDSTTGPSVAFSGEPGAFAEDAVLAAFGSRSLAPVGSFRAVFEAVRDGLADAGVVPIENVINGTVRENYDLLLEHDLLIRGEVVVPVRLCLAALPGPALDDIERVYSHIQALGQAEAFLRRRPWAAAHDLQHGRRRQAIADRAERGAAAVLSPRAAASSGWRSSPTGSDDPGNRTRFLRPGPARHAVPAAWRRPLGGTPAPRTTLVFAVRNEPGTLLAVLRVFADQRLNMSKLESRPSRERAWEYVFWVDLDADLLAPAAAGALEAIRPLTTMVRVLGAYQRAAGAEGSRHGLAPGRLLDDEVGRHARVDRRVGRLEVRRATSARIVRHGQVAEPVAVGRDDVPRRRVGRTSSSARPRRRPVVVPARRARRGRPS